MTRRRLRQLDRRAGNPQPGNHRQRPRPGSPARSGFNALSLQANLPPGPIGPGHP